MLRRDGTRLCLGPATAGKITVLALLIATMLPGGAVHADEFARDTDFLRAASAFGQRETADGKRAVAHTTNAEVRQAAEILRSDGEAATNQLALLATQKGWPVAPTSDLENGARYSDRSFIARQIENQQRAIGFYHQEALNGTDTDLQFFARDMLLRFERTISILRALRVS